MLYFWSRLLVHAIIYHFKILFEGVNLTFGVKGTLQKIQKIITSSFRCLL